MEYEIFSIWKVTKYDIFSIWKVMKYDIFSIWKMDFYSQMQCDGAVSAIVVRAEIPIF